MTCDDFAQAIADANPDSELARLLPQFKRWYSQAGTPRARAPAARTTRPTRSYTLSFVQSCAPTPGQPVKEPFVIPVNLGLLGADGRELPLQLAGEDHATQGTRTLVLDAPRRAVHLRESRRRAGAFDPARLQRAGVPRLRLQRRPAAHAAGARHRPLQPLGSRPAPGDARRDPRRSARRRSAPAKRRSTRRTSKPCAACCATRRSTPPSRNWCSRLPSETYIAEQLDVVDPQRVHAVREAMRAQLAAGLFADWEQAYERNRDTGAYTPDPVSVGPPRAGRPRPHPPVPRAHARRATPSGPARRCSASRTRAT